jgi:SAM-dependent methyltransferase
VATREVDLNELVTRLASRSKTRTESDLQSDVRTLLLYGGLNVGDADLNVLLETQAGERRRIDIEVGFTVIETKKDLRIGNVRGEAISQLAHYVAQRSHTLQQRYIGVLTDGADWYLYHLEPDNSLHEISEHHVDKSGPDVERLLVWLEGVLATSQAIKPTPLEITRRLGVSSTSHMLDRASLTALYSQTKKIPSVQVKRELWARLLTTALGEHFTDDDELFVRHTYLVMTAELIAHAVTGFNLANGEDLAPEDILTGKLFADAQIGGVVEPDFFDWVLEVSGGPAFVTALARRLARFDWSDVQHDVLKVLYESVIEADWRHRLGEYYTPDWLAERVVNQVIDDPISQRVLDPACGSGTFLFHAVRRYLAAAEKAGIGIAQALANVTSQIFGIDLHPVAVTLARVTYLLAIGSARLREDRGPLSIPVYLGDSLLWQQEENLFNAMGGLTISTTEGVDLFSNQLQFPAQVLANVAGFDQLVADLVDHAISRKAGDKVPDLTGLLERHNVHHDDRPVLIETFQILCRLHDEHRNHIWGYYVRNLARPRWLSLPENRVDRIVGNPPWLRYGAMTPGMQISFRQRCEERRLWLGAQLASRSDLSFYFVVRSVELFLRVGGKFGMLMPAAALARKPYESFRTGKWSSRKQKLTVAFDVPWDFTKVKSDPAMFPVPCSVLFAEHTAEVAKQLPHKMRRWSGRLPGHDIHWEEAGPHLRVSDDKIAVLGDEGSPYVSTFFNGATIFPKVLTFVEKVEAGPLGHSAGMQAIRSHRSSHEKAPWKNVESLHGTVEKRFLFPALTGESLLPYRISPPELVLLPIHRGKVLSAADGGLDKYWGITKWWSRAEKLWDELGTGKRTLSERIDYNALLSRQLPMSAQRVVFSRSGTQLAAARILGGSAVIDQTLVWAPVEEEHEALYLVGLLNSEPLGRRVAPYQSQGQFGARDFSKDVFNVPFGRYNPSERSHVLLSRLAREAEDIAAAVEVEADTYFVMARRKVRTALAAAGIAAAIDEAAEKILA